MNLRLERCPHIALAVLESLDALCDPSARALTIADLFSVGQLDWLRSALYSHRSEIRFAALHSSGELDGLF